MPRAFTLYWTNFKRFEECPQKFLWYKGWGTIDVGGGPGKGKPYPEEPSEHHAAMGTVVHAGIERLYKDELWRNPQTLVDNLKRTVRREFELELARRHINWSHRGCPTKPDMLQLCETNVLGYLHTMKHNRLLGPYAKTEVEILAYANPETPIGVRVDIIIRRSDTGITLLDGKNSKRYKDRKGNPLFYVDPDQLRWSAMAFYLKHGRMPDRLGFVYFRYPWGFVHEGETEPVTGVEWVPFTMEDLAGLGHRAIKARAQMEREEFPAQPVPKMCKFCDFQSICPERQAQIEKNRRRPKNKDDFWDGLDAEPGLIEISL